MIPSNIEQVCNMAIAVALAITAFGISVRVSEVESKLNRLLEEPGVIYTKPDASVNPDALPEDQEPGVYVWHCHITDHEDNEMMRPTWSCQPCLMTRGCIRGSVHETEKIAR